MGNRHTVTDLTVICPPFAPYLHVEKVGEKFIYTAPADPEIVVEILEPKQKPTGLAAILERFGSPLPELNLLILHTFKDYIVPPQPLQLEDGTFAPYNVHDNAIAAAHRMLDTTPLVKRVKEAQQGRLHVSHGYLWGEFAARTIANRLAENGVSIHPTFGLAGRRKRYAIYELTFN